MALGRPALVHQRNPRLILPLWRISEKNAGNAGHRATLLLVFCTSGSGPRAVRSNQ